MSHENPLQGLFLEIDSAFNSFELQPVDATHDDHIPRDSSASLGVYNDPAPQTSSTSLTQNLNCSETSNLINPAESTHNANDAIEAAPKARRSFWTRFKDALMEAWGNIPLRKWQKVLICLVVGTVLFSTGHLLGGFLPSGGHYGFEELHRTSNCLGMTAFRLGIVSILLNVLALVTATMSDNARQLLLAPTRQFLDREHRKYQTLNLGRASWRNWWRAPWYKKVLWLILVATSLPIHLLYNSIVLQSETAYGAYEVLVSPGFIEDRPFDILALNLTSYPDAQSPIPYGSPWPSAYPGLDELQNSLQQVHDNTSTWQKHSESDCRLMYNKATYASYRNMMMVTNWTGPDFGNSALAIGALAGYQSYGVPNPMLALCPDAYLKVNSGSFQPKSAVYVQTADIAGEGPSPGAVQPTYDENVFLAGPDLCYDFWNNKINSTYSSSRGLFISYCLVEQAPKTCRLLYSTHLVKILGFVLLTKAVCMILVFFCLERNILPALGDAIVSFIRDPDSMTKDRSLQVNFSKERWQAAPAPLSMDSHYPLHPNMKDSTAPRGKLGFCLRHWPWLAVTLIATLWCCVMFSNGTGKLFLRGGASPQSESDSTWFVGILLYTNSLHILFTLREFLENNTIKRKEISREFVEYRYYYQRLRVSEPVGDQRGTRLLTVRPSLAIAMGVLSVLTHTVLSTFISSTAIDLIPLGTPVTSQPRTSMKLNSRMTTLLEPNDGIIQNESFKVPTFLGFVGLFLVLHAFLFVLTYYFFRNGLRNAVKEFWEVHEGRVKDSTCSAFVSAACHVCDSTGDIHDRAWRSEIAGSEIRWKVVVIPADEPPREGYGPEPVGRHYAFAPS